MEDPGVIQAAWDLCPTGNVAGGGTPTGAAGANPLRQGGVPCDHDIKDCVRPDGAITETDSGTATQGPGIANGDCATPSPLPTATPTLEGGPAPGRPGFHPPSLGQVGCVAGHLALGLASIAEAGTFIAAGIAAPIAVAALAPEVAAVTVPGSIALISVPLVAGGLVYGAHGVQAIAEVKQC